jgi:hypothetical protein
VRRDQHLPASRTCQVPTLRRLRSSPVSMLFPKPRRRVALQHAWVACPKHFGLTASEGPGFDDQRETHSSFTRREGRAQRDLTDEEERSGAQRPGRARASRPTSSASVGPLRVDRDYGGEQEPMIRVCALSPGPSLSSIKGRKNAPLIGRRTSQEPRAHPERTEKLQLPTDLHQGL